MKTRLAFLIALSVVAPSAPLLAQQPMSTRNDFAGTWVINKTKSDFGVMPPPTTDSSTIVRVGAEYHIDALTDFGGQGLQHRVFKWPVGEGETTTDMVNGATIHTVTKLQNDTITFSSTVSVQGQTVALQTGRMYRSQDGTTLTREMEMQLQAGQSTEPMHFRLVYDRR
jgi:hypothetical protein